MNEKSIDKIKGLLKNARDTSVWWGKNKKDAQKYASVGKVFTWTVAFLSVCMALGGFFWIMSSASVLIGLLKGVTFFAGAGGLIYMCNGLLSNVNGHLAKKFEDGHKLCGFDYRDEIQLDANENVVENVLRTARSTPLAEVQNLCPHLEKLRNASLPLSWWRQMKRALHDLEIPNNTVWEDNSHDILEQVYVEMSEMSDSNTNVGTRVLKL